MEGSGAQIVQQIEGLLAQLAEQEPEPEIQRAIQAIQTQLEPLQQVVGKDDEQDMQSGLVNPGGAPPPMNAAGLGGAGGGPSLEGGSQSDTSEIPPSGGEKGPVHALEIHIKPAPKSFGAANKAAMATHREKGHFNPRGEKGEPQESQRSRYKAGKK